jgi:predicted permease
MRAWIVRGARRLVPAGWRTSATDDVADAASIENHGASWVAWQLARIGIRMRLALAADGGRVDVAHAVRSLARARWFTSGAVLVFALGIGVNIAVFAAVDRALFRELPYERPAEIVVMNEVDSSGRAFGTVPAAVVLEVRRHHRGIVDLSVSGFTRSFFLNPGFDGGLPLHLTSVTYNTLKVFGVRVMLGRDFTSDDAAAKARVALISFDAWKRVFAASADILGHQIYSPLESGPVEIIGVLPERFIPPSSFLDPLSDGLVLDPGTFATAAPTARSYPPYVRLRPGVSIQAAKAEMDALVQGVRRDLPRAANSSGSSIQLVPLRTALFGRYVEYLWLIVGAASLVLAVACANLGSLMLVRNRSRDHLLATQIALGASRWRLVRVGLIESMLLSVAGGVVALLVMSWSDAAFRAVLPPLFSRYAVDTSDARVLVFALLVAAACTAAAGAYPSWRMSRVDVLPLLQSGAGPWRSGRLRGSGGLLVVEAALSVMLVAGTAMTGRSLAAVSATDLGFQPDNLYTVSLSWPRGSAPGGQFQDALRVIEALSSTPGVLSAAGVDINPLSGAVGMDLLGPGLRSTSRWRVTSGFFDTMNTRVLAGRQLSEAEITADSPVGVLSESGLRLVLPGLRPDEAIGRTLRFPGEEDRVIVGVVSDVRSSHAATPIPSMYLPLSARGFRRAEFMIRLAPGTMPVLADIRSRVRQARVPAVSVNVGDVSQRLRSGLTDQRFRALLFAVFGVFALLLAALGLFAVGAYEVTRREREIGIRLAIGGSIGSVEWLMLRQALIPVTVGICAGLCGTIWAASFVQSFLYKVDAADPLTLATVVLVLLASTTVAAWLPARRAGRLDPAAVLRAQ